MQIDFVLTLDCVFQFLLFQNVIKNGRAVSVIAFDSLLSHSCTQYVHISPSLSAYSLWRLIQCSLWSTFFFYNYFFMCFSFCSFRFASSSLLPVSICPSLTLLSLLTSLSISRFSYSSSSIWLLFSLACNELVVLAARVFVIKFAFISLVNSFFFSFLFLFACVCAPVQLCVCVRVCVCCVVLIVVVLFRFLNVQFNDRVYIPWNHIYFFAHGISFNYFDLINHFAVPLFLFFCFFFPYFSVAQPNCR